MYTTKTVEQTFEPRPAGDHANASLHKVEVRVLSEEVDDISLKGPELRKVNWLREPNLRQLYLCVMVLMVASATTGYDGMLANTLQLLDRWGKFFPETASSNYLGLLVNMFNIGSIVSFFITPYVADNFGRKISIISGCLLMICGGTLSSFSNSFWVFIVGRFIVGFGNSLSQMASPLLLTEICHPQHRGPLTAVYNCLWNGGALLVAWAGWGTSRIQNDWSWRSLTLLQILPSVTQLAFIYWVPESPRYLISKGRYGEALRILTHYHGGGNIRDITAHFEFREIRETLALEKDTASKYIDFFKTRGNRRRLVLLVSLAIISQYSGNALFSNYINSIYEGAGVTDEDIKLTVSGCKMILDLIVTVAAAMNVDRFGRRPMFLFSLSGMVLSAGLWTLCGILYENSHGTNATVGYVQLVFIWIFGIFYDIGFTGLLIAYAIEILPFHLRAKGLTVLNIVIQSFLALGNQTNKLAWDSLPNHWNLMIFYALWDLLELVFVYFFYVETRGPTLEEIARIFDGRHAVKHINMAALETELLTGRLDQQPPQQSGTSSNSGAKRWFKREGARSRRQQHQPQNPLGNESRETILMADQRAARGSATTARTEPC